MLRKHAVAPESNSTVYQLKDYVLALLTDRRDMFHLNNEFAATKVGSCLLTSIPQLGRPGGNELSLYNQPPLPSAIHQRDLQHCFFPLVAKARRTPNLWSRKSLNFQERNARTRNIKVEEVESVETVEATGELGLG
jgi:hypothetical protein